MVTQLLRVISLAAILVVTLLLAPTMAADAVTADAAAAAENPLDIRSLLSAGGTIGLVIVGLSVAMVALIVEHLLSIRRSALMPSGLADSLHRSISEGQFQAADKLCREQPSYLSDVVSAGLQEVGLGYAAVEKGMEDSSAEQAARLYRKIEYLSVIGTLAPMIGLMGTVWGMIQAFSEFASKAVPQPSEFAPGISQALVTTLFGLGVAVPALAAFALFRNRIDEFVAETSLMAEQVFTPYKRGTAGRRAANDPAPARPSERRASRPANPPVAAEREATS